LRPKNEDAPLEEIYPQGEVETGPVSPTERERGTGCVDLVGCLLENYRDL
jgi:hypothetical protein